MTKATLSRRAVLAGAAAALAAPAIHAEEPWPRGRQLRVIVPWPPGAANDLLGRLFAQRLNEKLGANAFVENRVGGSGWIGTSAVIQAQPDGYTLLASAFNTAVMPLVLKVAASFNPETDLAVMARTATAPLVLVSTPHRPQRTVAEVLAAAKASPKDWTFAISSFGSAGHLATIEFLRRADAAIELAPYRGTQPALTDIIAGNVQLLIDPSFALLPAAREGRARALGIATRERSALAPDVPTMAEAGMPGYEFQSWYGIWGPKGTPEPIIAQVNALMRETMREAETRARLTQMILEPVDETVEDTKRFIAAEIVRARELLRSVNYEPQ
ncbi:MAG: tripartite tricarboxylate transporter substrate binding protein [Acetobacteraceae bacterium]|nr:tripartite tricarboxylate transporter substrate binding protein [Acetobacteraceae bacterium]